MNRWPWNRRAQAAEQAAERARRELAQTRDRWPEVHEVVDVTRYHRELNGWTATVLTIISGQ